MTRWGLFSILIAACTSATADTTPTGYQCAPGTSKIGFGCTCPAGYFSKVDKDGIAACIRLPSECERAIGPIARALGADLGHEEFVKFRASSAEPIRKRCEGDPWPLDVKRCVAGSQREETTFACLEKLSADVRARLELDAANAMPQTVEITKTEVRTRAPIVFLPKTPAVSNLKLVEEVAKALKKQQIVIEVQVHADKSDGNSAALTKARADQIRTLLINAGIKAERVTAKGYADTQPAASASTAWGRARNRRVQLVVLAAAPSSGDRDGDGISDGVDRCPELAETQNGFEDTDGCPDSIVIARSQGCSDGTREALQDTTLFPDIAGCGARWPMASLSAPRSGADACGGDVSCAVPADACQTGWHVCGVKGPKELVDNLSGKQCAGLSRGGFVAAQPNAACDKCGTGGGYGAACCGRACVQELGSCVWPGSTAWFGVIDGHLQSCGQLEMRWRTDQYGVLCCKD